MKMGVMKEPTPEELFKALFLAALGPGGARASHSSGFSGCRAQAPRGAGSTAVVRQGCPPHPWNGESSWTRMEPVPLHWTIGEVLKVFIVIFPPIFCSFGHPW